jgi:hypothetical protein
MLHHFRVEMFVCIVLDVIHRLLYRPRSFVRSDRGQRIENVGESDDTSGLRNGNVVQTIRVAAAIPFLVMRERDLAGQIQQVGLIVVQNMGTDGSNKSSPLVPVWICWFYSGCKHTNNIPSCRATSEIILFRPIHKERARLPRANPLNGFDMPFPNAMTLNNSPISAGLVSFCN